MYGKGQRLRERCHKRDMIASEGKRQRGILESMLLCRSRKKIGKREDDGRLPVLLTLCAERKSLVFLTSDNP
jgi:hypothetical protein